MRRAIVFDLDGTLIDSLPDIHAAVAETLAAEGAAPLDPARVRSFIGDGVPVLIDRVIAAAGLDPAGRDRIMEGFRRRYDADPLARTRLYPGAAAALEALEGAGIALGLCTNKDEAATRRVLEGLGIEGRFGVVAGGDTLPQRKPDPAPLRHCFDALGGDARLYVGDSEVDAETARRAGVPFALFTPGYRRAAVEQMPHDHAFDDFAALPDLVTRAFAGA